MCVSLSLHIVVTWQRTCASLPSPLSHSGDNARVAQAVAHAVGIKDFRSGLKPEDKLAYIKAAAAAAAAAEGSKPGSGADGLLMAGDGINDAPALAAAQVTLRAACLACAHVHSLEQHKGSRRSSRVHPNSELSAGVAVALQSQVAGLMRSLVFCTAPVQCFMLVLWQG